jgi:glutamate-1-semialdehyde 2,1-aminomutase
VAKHLIAIGSQVMDGWEAAARRVGLKLHASGLPSLCHFAFEHEDELVLTTLFTQIMLEKGYLACTQFKPSLAHTQQQVDGFLAALEDAFAILAESLDRGTSALLLKGPVAQRGFYRLT